MIKIVEKIPAFKLSHWLLRLPLSIVFIQQGLSKFPVKLEDAQGYDLSYLTWWVVAYGELGSGLGLIISGIFLFGNSFFAAVGDLVTRFSGFTIGCITGVAVWHFLKRAGRESFYLSFGRQLAPRGHLRTVIVKGG